MFKKLLAVLGIAVLLTGCIANRQHRKISLSERVMSAELVNSFIKYQIATLYTDELFKEDANALILSHKEYVKIFVERYGVEIYQEIGEMYYDEFITIVTLNLIKAVQGQDIMEMFQLQYAYQNIVVDPIYIEDTTKDLDETFTNFNEKEFLKTMETMKISFVNKWNLLVKENK